MNEINTFYTDKQAKEAIIEFGKRMYNSGFVAANDGNISCKVSENTFWVTPTGVSKGFMTEDMLIKMDLDGNILTGGVPSSETKMHIRVYKENPTVKGVVHAHPAKATAFAIAGVPLELAVLPEAIVNLGRVPVTKYATPSTEEVPDSIAPYCRDYNAVLLANHGVLTWGQDIVQAYFRMESVEHYAKILMDLRMCFSNINILTRQQVNELVKIREKLGITTGGMPTTSEDTLLAR